MTTRIHLLKCGVTVLLSLFAVDARAQEPLTPVVEQILAVWRTVDLVCLGEDHARKNDSDLRLALVRHPTFTNTVNVIVVEFANPVHQALLDRFIIHGDDMTRDEIGVVWRDATGPAVWESPIYEAFLRAIRDVNRTVPQDKRVRVLAGDTAIDWKSITTASQLVPLLKAGLQNRGANIRRIIAEQVLEQNVKALAIYGAGHCVKVGMGFPGELMDKYPGRMWSVSSLPAIARLSGTGTSSDSAQRDRELFKLTEQPAYLVITGTKWETMPAQAIVGTRPSRTLGDMADAFVSYGDAPDLVVEPDRTELETKYRAELARRRRLLSEAQRLVKQR